MAKRNSRSGNKSTKSKASKSIASRTTTGLVGSYDQATKAVSRAVSKVPSSAFYWGLGSLALGAAAVGAYMYRDRLVEAYEEAMETYMGKDSASTSTSSQADQGRKSKNSGSQATVDRH